MIRNIILTVTLLSLSLLQASQSIEQIKYSGLAHMLPIAAERMLKLKVGDELESAKVDEAIKEFYRQGYFNDIYATFEDGVLTLVFVEKPTVSEVELVGYKESDDEFIEQTIQIKSGTLYDESKIKSAKERILKVLEDEGKLDSIVEVNVKHNSNSTVDLEFIVNEGETILIERLRLKGATNLSSSDFNKVIVNKEHEFMGWFWGRNDGEMALEQLEYDPLRIADKYMQHGYMDIRVDEPFVRVDFDNYSATIDYDIKEGDQYSVSSIKLYQQERVVDEQELKELLRLEVSEPFNIQTFRDDSERLKLHIADLGYAYAQVYPDIRKNTDDRTVDVIYRISAGEKVYIRDVIISGNSRTLDRIVRRELYLGPTDLYSLTDLKDSRNALGRTGFFESSIIEEMRVDDSTMDLVVKVKETPTGKIQIGGGYGSYGGFSLNVGLSDRNIFGSGIDVGVQAERSQKSSSYSFNISNPRLNDSDFSGNFSLFYNDFEYSSYSTRSNGITVGTGHRFSRHIRGYLNYTYSNVDYYDINTTTYDESRQRYFESYSKSALSIGATFDNTDNYYVAREGWVVTQGFEKGGIGAEADYFKSRTTLSKYNSLEKLVNFDLIFRYKMRYYFAKDTGYLPYAERYYMGGIGSVRGYSPYQLPYYTSRTTGKTVRISGKQTLSNNFELSFPLLPSAKMRFGLFVDWGWIGEESLDEFSRGGYGVSLEWFSPMGPLQLVYANAINPDGDDKTSNFEFTIGRRF